MAELPPHEATRLLARAGAGDAGAAERLYAIVHAELRRLAEGEMRGERADHTLQPTALVHEAWLRLFPAEPAQWKDKKHFLACAALAMRRVLVDHARGRGTAKRGGGRERVLLDEALARFEERAVDVLVLDEALSDLAERDAELARLVELRFFGGLTAKETGEVLGLSVRQVEGAWVTARGWLHRRLKDEGRA